MASQVIDPRMPHGPTILVTGGTRGIGRAISLAMARSGANVVANFVRDTNAAATLQQQANEEGLSLHVVRADLTSPKGIEELVRLVGESHAVLSALVYCAATGVHKSLEDLTLRHFDWTFNLNVRAFFDLVQRLVPKMERGSSIVGVSSAGAMRAVAQYTVVGASKGALEAMLRHLAVELAPRGIRVNAVAPGAVNTDVWKIMPDAERRLADAAARSPLRRLVTPEEVADVVRFLCSTAASGIVGQTLTVDGGAGLVAD